MTKRMMFWSSYLWIIPLSLSLGSPSVISTTTLVASGEAPAFGFFKMSSLKQMWNYPLKNEKSSKLWLITSKNKTFILLQLYCESTSYWLPCNKSCYLMCLELENGLCNVTELTAHMSERRVCWWVFSYGVLSWVFPDNYQLGSHWSQTRSC